MSDLGVSGGYPGAQRMPVSQRLPVITLVVSALFAIALGFDLLPAIGVGFFFLSFVWYVSALGRELAIAPIAALIASAQWLLGPALAYEFGLQTEKYRMYVPSDEYFSFVVPSVFFFYLGLVYFAPRISLDNIRARILEGYRIPDKTVYLIFAAGFFADLSAQYAPSAIGFAFFIVSQFKYIAIAYMMILRVKWRWFAIIAAFVALFGTSLATGMFHVLALWSALILSFIAYEFRLSILTKVIILLALALATVQLQATKSAYRQIIGAQPDAATTENFARIYFDSAVFSSFVFGGDILSDLNARLNQGWIISAVMAYTPRFQSFENGRTVVLAIRDSLVPRFLVEKRTVEVSDAFRKYTGLEVGRHTSFGISVLGEAWVNFGGLGFLFMGVFGIFYGYILRYLKWMSRTYPTYLLWAPLVFLQAIKAETELLIVMNHIVKSLIVIYFIYFTSYKIFRIRI